MDKHSFPNGKRLVRDTLKPDDNLHYEQFQDGTINEYENELPFEIPSKWVWCNLGMLFSHNTGKALNASKTDGASLTYITTSNVYWNSFELGNLKIMPFTDSEIEKCTVKKGDLLVCEGGDIGRAAIWQFENEIRIQNHLHRLRPYDRIYTKFYYYIMYLYKANGRINGNGIGLQGLSSNALHNIIVPVPPVEEQKRIVDSIDSVLSLIEQIESHKQNLSSQIDNIKSKILDLAIRGKLVPQDPNDEPASVLLERIRAEKEELIKQGKIKRDKKESVIFKGDDNKYYERIGGKDICIDDEILFEIPDSWVWCRLGFLFNHNTGKALNASNKEGSMLPYITTSNLYWGQFDLSSVRQMYFKDSEIEKCSVSNGDLLVCEGGDIGRAAIWPYDTPMCIQNHIHKLRSYNQLDTLFYYYIFQAYKYNGYIGGKGIGIQGLSSKALHNMLVPLPPINEQIRITSKISSLFQFI